MKAKQLSYSIIAALIALSCGCTEQTMNGIPNVLPDTLQVKRLQKTYVITGLAESNNKQVAIINGLVVTEGMELDPGVVVQDIEMTYATIFDGEKEHMIRPDDVQRELNKQQQANSGS